MNRPSNVLRAAVRAALALSASAVASNAIGQVEEITVTGNVLQSNQVNSMQPPLAIINVLNQSLSRLPRISVTEVLGSSVTLSGTHPA